MLLPELQAFCPKIFATGGAAAPPAPPARTPMAETQGKTVLIYGLSIENVGMLNLYTMRKITNGTLHTSGLISERDKLEE